MASQPRGFNIQTLRTRTKETMRALGKRTKKGGTVNVKKEIRTLVISLPQGANLAKFVELPAETVSDCLERLEEAHPNWTDEQRKIQADIDAKNEWVGCNVLDFFNQVATIYGLCEEFHVQMSSQDSYKKLYEQYKDSTHELIPFSYGFPPDIQYKLKEKRVDDLPYSGQRYVHWSLVWVEEQLFQKDLFPETEGDSYPPDFVKVMDTIMKRMFRVYAIIIVVCLPFFAEQQGKSELEQCFKHFYFFTREWDMIPDVEKKVFTPKSVKIDFKLATLDQEFNEAKAALKEFEERGKGRKKKMIAEV